jgi:hypothetical protein
MLADRRLIFKGFVAIDIDSKKRLKKAVKKLQVKIKDKQSNLGAQPHQCS